MSLEYLYNTEFMCPYCQTKMVLIPMLHKRYRININEFQEIESMLNSTECDISKSNGTLQIDFMKCPSCHKLTITCCGYSKDLKEEHIEKYILPKSGANKFPNYIPLQIREDYEEAYAILNLSPKASATLSRRCLQGMIRDFWGITRKRLVDEINEISDKIRPEVFRAITGLRKIGNIGAHMEKDVNQIVDIEPGEAEKLLKLIELLIDDWYIKRHESKLLCDEIDKMATDKK